MPKAPVEGAKRTDVWYMPIEEVNVDFSWNGRFAEPDKNHVRQLAESIAKHGQQQAALVRRKDGQLTLSAGFQRARAVTMIAEDDELRQMAVDNGSPVVNKDGRVVLMTRLSSMDDKTAFMHNIVENNDRAQASPMDHAWNQQRLRDEFGMNDQQISAFYNVTKQHVWRHKKLLQLTKEAQNAVHQGELGLTAAVSMAEVPADEQREQLQEARGEDGRVHGGAIQERVRQRRQSEGRGLTRTMSDMRYLANAFLEHDDPRKQEIGEAMVAYIRGEHGHRAVLNAADRAFEMELEPA